MRESFFSLILLSLIFSCTIYDSRRLPADAELNEIQQVLTRELSPERQAELDIIKENTLKFMLHSVGLSDSEKINHFLHARDYLYTSLFRVGKNTLAEAAEIAPTYEIQRPPRWTLKDEINWLVEKTMNAEERLNPAIIERLNVLFRETDLSVIPWNNLPAEYEARDIQQFLTELQSIEDDDIRILRVMNKIEEQSQQFLQRVSTVGSQLASNPEINLGSEELTKFARLFLDHYFENVNLEVQKTIISELIALGEDASDMQKAEVLFLNAGPGLGKSLQQFVKGADIGEGMKEVMEIIESDGKAVPKHLASLLIATDVGGYNLSDLADDPIGTGTVAETRKATLTYTPRGQATDVVEPAAVRYLKPGIESRASEDIYILRSFLEKVKREQLLPEAMIPNLDRLVKGIQDFLYEELDIQKAIEKQRTANRIYSKSIIVKIDEVDHVVKFTIPTVYEAPTEQGNRLTKLHVQQFLPPKTKFSEIQSDSVKRATALGMFELFMDESLLESGFMHFDLHQGNFSILNVSPEKIIEVGIYDYGMSDTLNEVTRRSFILIGAGADYQSRDLLERGFALLFEEQGRNLKARKLSLSRALKKEFKINKVRSAEDWVFWALENGFLENEELAKIARGTSLVTQLIEDVGVKERAMEEFEDRAATKLLQGKSRTGFPLSVLERYFLVRSHLNYSCISLVNKFLGR